jgi:hypothetical protein
LRQLTETPIRFILIENKYSNEAKVSDHNHNPEYKTMMDALVKGMPGVKDSKAFGYPAYKVNGKVFAFVGGSGVAIKLPAARVQELIANHDEMKPFEVADGVVWREWVSINKLNSERYVQYIEWIEESVQFVVG